MATEVLHLPVGNCSGDPTSMLNYAIIFRPCANKTGILMLGNKETIDKMDSMDVVENPYITSSSHAV